MNKSLGWLFAAVSMLLLLACAISIDYNGWLAAGFGIVAIAFIGYGFTLKARLTRQRG
ncbi:hypothetical protein [Cohnella nanjingensis]|uniref:DUF5325 family protein n=1 Tax=Cohnella nanjingensis TaxID=1387779 RepID=A0A7X0VED6_9BACL|nr:hypothetical protein [Cohnella nanjingensis]MBB6670900.1 hypothetical protein [Cohnella nanjingensis]